MSREGATGEFLDALAAEFPAVEVLGYQVETVPLETLAERLIMHLEVMDRPLQIVTLNPEMIELAESDREHRERLRGAELIVADGQGIRWAARRLTRRLIPLVPGIDLVEALLQRSAARGWEVYLLGSAPGVAAEATSRLRERMPGLNIVGSDHGFHQGKDELRITNTIIALQPDILLVGMGAPRQEEFIARLKPQLNRTLLIGVGGTLDVFAGHVQRAPGWARTLRLEWLIRMLRQPARLKRLPKLLAFVRRVLSVPPPRPPSSPIRGGGSD